jgi:hypothetical protein
MSIPPLSPTTAALLKAARSDVPTGAARTKMWAGVSSAAGGAAASVAATSAAASTSAGGSSGSAAGTGGALVGGGAGALKMIVLGTLLGGTLTVGTAAVLLHVGPARVGPASAVAAAKAPLATGATGAAGDDTPTGASHGEGPGSATTILSSTAATTPLAQGDLATPSSSLAGAPDTTLAASTGSASPAGRSTRGGHGRANHRIEDSSSLSLEASLITEARSALAEGDALAALRKARAARTLPVRQLVPEELAVEAQALRALGRDVEANAVDQALRAQYPESALAR